MGFIVPRKHERTHWRAKELAEAVGVHVDTIRKMAHRGELPFDRVGRLMLFPRAAVKRLVRSGYHLKV